MDVTLMSENKVSLYKNGTTTAVYHVEATRQELVLEVFSYFLQRDDVRLLHNLCWEKDSSVDPISLAK